MKEDEVGEACSMHVSNEKLIQNYFRKMWRDVAIWETWE
jgi:hypothetical protein